LTVTESESLQIGTGFGTTTDIEQGPDGNLYVVSITDNAIYKISRKP
jgi:glucose/arabinose dehydrogenase